MVIDTSAVLSILLKEPERERFIDAMDADPVRLMSAVNALEAAMMIEARKREPGGREFDLLLHCARIEILPFTEEHMEAARRAWRKYGKGNHPASLNICDCCAYALSRISGEPLLFKGADFTATDVVPSLKQANGEHMPVLRLVLHKTYYTQGFFNVPVAYDRYVGPHRSAIEICLEDVTVPLAGLINRTAQQNGAPRIIGGAALKEYFQSRFNLDQTVEVVFESPNRILLRKLS